ncbi:unnamed protein product [Thlaspi arvense]|uniref:Ubiquitin-like protease family profile domain-containing protein n=1 Tax=Thlaspi arvense TaxID=13288 RepID=A0AAU9SHT9_THLAR|nr:unnamed protein product [Thlaspi arvense]
MLKNDVEMPPRRRLQLAIICILDGVLIANTQVHRPTPRYVRMVDDLEHNMGFPWGRESFYRAIGAMMPEVMTRDKRDWAVQTFRQQLSVGSMRVCGFALALQLLAFEVIPGLREKLKDGGEFPILIDHPDDRIPRHWSLRLEAVREVEADSAVCPLLNVHPAEDEGWGEWDDESKDGRVKYLIRKIKDGHGFTKPGWPGGDTRFPLKVVVPIISKLEHARSIFDRNRRDGKKVQLKASPAKMTNMSNRKKRKVVEDVSAAALIEGGDLKGGSIQVRCCCLSSLRRSSRFRSRIHLGKTPESMEEVGEGSVKGDAVSSPCLYESIEKDTGDRAQWQSDDVMADGQTTVDGCGEASVEGGDDVGQETLVMQVALESAVDGNSCMAGDPVAKEVVGMESVIVTEAPDVNADVLECPQVKHCMGGEDVLYINTDGQVVMDTTKVDEFETTVDTERNEDMLSDVADVSLFDVDVDIIMLGDFIADLFRCQVVTDGAISGEVGHVPSPEEVKLAVALKLKKKKPFKTPIHGLDVDIFKWRHLSKPGYAFNNNFLLDLATAQEWVSTLHMEVLMSWLSSKKVGHEPVAFCSPNLIRGLLKKEHQFKASKDKDLLHWYDLSLYVSVPGRRWVEDTQTMYVPMCWADELWVGLAINLSLGHIEILDPYPPQRSDEEVEAWMKPICCMLSYASGDCGPIAVKFMEMHAAGDPSPHMFGLTDDAVDDFQKQYAMDLYRDLVVPLYSSARWA